MKNNDVTAENIWVQIIKQLKNFTLKYIVDGINIHPDGNIDLFTDMLECELCNIRQSNIVCIIAGDINTDLSKLILLILKLQVIYYQFLLCLHALLL